MTPAEQRIADPARLAAVRATGLLDAPPSAVLDELCAAAVAAVDADAVMVTLLDKDRQWFAGAYGLDGAVAVEHARPLATLDRRALDTYRVLGVEVELLS